MPENLNLAIEKKATNLGLALAMVMRILLLFGTSLQTYEKPF